MDSTKIALVTGGSRGLGKNGALALADKGIGVIVTYHSREEDAAEVVREIQQKGAKAKALQLDTSDVAGFGRFIDELKSALADDFGAGSFDFLVNNAGVGIATPLGSTEEANIDYLFNIHFKGVYMLTEKLLPFLNDGGRVINFSSGLTRVSRNTCFSVYASMKGAVEVLTRYMAVDLGPRGITVNNIAPGAIETDFGGGAVRDNADYNKMVASSTALGRAGLPDDIGGVVAFLCSDEARWINGQRIEVSGGMSL
jgi:NAD(P)-dependent dehydrogenase (short-subunit alcohol dehydrogenase family)